MSMSHAIVVRALTRADLPAVAAILARVDLFPPAMLGPMIEPYLSGDAPHRWLVAQAGETVLGFAYAEPERMTEGSYNLLAIAVDPASQRAGIGTAIVAELRHRLREADGRILIVETSSLDAFAGTRAFYARQDFAQEARIRDFYSDGEDKVVFWTRL